MIAQGSSKYPRSRRMNRICLALMLVMLGFTVIVETFHGHACTEDGCTLCLAATIANVLLVTCVGLTLVQPVLRDVFTARPIRTLARIVSDAKTVLCEKLNQSVRLTPVTMGVRLLI